MIWGDLKGNEIFKPAPLGSEETLGANKSIPTLGRP